MHLVRIGGLFGVVGQHTFPIMFLNHRRSSCLVGLGPQLNVALHHPAVHLPVPKCHWRQRTHRSSFCHEMEKGLYTVLYGIYNKMTDQNKNLPYSEKYRPQTLDEVHSHE